MLNQVLKSKAAFTAEDMEIARAVRDTVSSPGWRYLEEKIWPDLMAFFKKKAYAARKEDIAWKLIGLMEGHEITIESVKRFVRLAEERDQSFDEAGKFAQLSKELEEEAAVYGA